jgi:short subunit fatty acids transporter
MQMALMLLLTAAISQTPAFRKGILALAQLPTNVWQVFALATLSFRAVVLARGYPVYLSAGAFITQTTTRWKDRP